MKTIRPFSVFTLAVFACLLMSIPRVGRAQEDSGTKLGLQAWTFNRNTFTETVEKAKALGLKYLQAYPRQTLGGGLTGKFEPTMDVETQAKVLALLKDNGVELVSFGVVRGEDEAGWKQLFEFAKAMGIKDLTVEPKADVLPLLDKLSKEYGISVSIHNHGGNVEERLEQLKPYGANMGLCADTGHWVRHGREPVSTLKLAEGRIISVHFKDMSAAAKDGHTMPYGKGVSKLTEQLAELKRQGFNGVAFIEYEHKTPELDANVKECVEFFQSASASLK